MTSVVYTFGRNAMENQIILVKYVLSLATKMKTKTKRGKKQYKIIEQELEEIKKIVSCQCCRLVKVKMSKKRTKTQILDHLPRLSKIS